MYGMKSDKSGYRGTEGEERIERVKINGYMRLKRGTVRLFLYIYMLSVLTLDADHDPAATARKERKARIAKNEAQHAANVAKASQLTPNEVQAAREAKTSIREKRKKELERGLLISKTATASMGKFDKKIEGEPKVKGVKRKFEDNLATGGWGQERGKAMDVLKSVESGERKKNKGTQLEEGGVSHRKAVRHLGREQRAEKKRGKR